MSITPTAGMLLISIESQAMAHVIAGSICKEYVVSTSKNPPSCIEDSFGTPLGLHCIADKIGEGAPLGTVFKGRVSTGLHFSAFPEEEQKKNLITTRILRLRGLEPGRNSGPGRDSYDRYVYIHGTNHESRIGHPFSGGCIELKNEDMHELFNVLQGNELVWITKD